MRAPELKTSLAANVSCGEGKSEKESPEMLSTILSQLREGYFPISVPELARIDAYIAQASQKMNEYQESISNLQRCLDSARSLTSPIRKLPPDVLGEIFAIASRDKPTDTRFSSRKEKLVSSTEADMDLLILAKGSA
ncbi:hypothetical protein BT96DRAFT_131146 [Gymnopus androsaceus JB14]|uniref:Uncharacterized protein n=1 Tax=Gymnopus androsaceus JB14 TaxID=1447944 RepID=A0A6A4IC60_9AGAR|nr:hypothetical protein BT96DRAFT_131146 [Gymnopus androsaceus JB14]